MNKENLAELYAFIKSPDEDLEKANSLKALKESAQYKQNVSLFIEGYNAALIFGLATEYIRCIFQSEMTPFEACFEWDCLPEKWLDDYIQQNVER